MRLNDRRESTNIEDRRGQSSSGGGLGGLGGGLGNIGGGDILGGLSGLTGGGGKCGCLIIAAIFLLFMLMGGKGCDLSSLGNLGGLTTGSGSGSGLPGLEDIIGGGSSSQTDGNYSESEAEAQLKSIAAKVLAGTEDVWTKRFQEIGKTYEPPKMVLYSNFTRSGCGSANASVGPFYCSADQMIYLDLSFFTSMRTQLGIDKKGQKDLDFAYAYVIAHEVGHAVQDQLGILGQAHQQMAQMSETESNKMSVRIELQADYLAGVWGHYDNAQFNSLEEGDLEEAIETAEKIGDDYLQKSAQGYAVPDAFTHGTSAQREKWLKKGLNCSSNWYQEAMQTFKVAYSQL